MKAKTKARSKRPRKSRSRKSVSVHFAGRVASFFKKKRKNSLWNTSFGRVWSVLGALK